jgi:hypothetical protein
LGQVIGRTPEKFDYYSSVGLQTIIDPKKVPSVGEPNIKYSGFLYEPVRRPLLATSGKRLPSQAPDQWKKQKQTKGGEVAPQICTTR